MCKKQIVDMMYDLKGMIDIPVKDVPPYIPEVLRIVEILIGVTI